MQLQECSFKTRLRLCACTPPHGAFKAIRDALLSFSIMRVPARARISSLWRQDLCSSKPLEVNIFCPERNQRPDGHKEGFPSCGYWDIRILLRSLLFRFYYVPLFIQNSFYTFIVLQLFCTLTLPEFNMCAAVHTVISALFSW